MPFEVHANDVMFCGCDVPAGMPENYATTTLGTHALFGKASKSNPSPGISKSVR